MSAIQVEIHGLADLEAQAFTQLSSCWVELKFAAEDGSEFGMCIWFRGETAEADAEAFAAAINRLRKPQPDPEPSHEVNYDCDPIADQRMDAADVGGA